MQVKIQALHFYVKDVWYVFCYLSLTSVYQSLVIHPATRGSIWKTCVWLKSLKEQTSRYTIPSLPQLSRWIWRMLLNSKMQCLFVVIVCGFRHLFSKSTALAGFSFLPKARRWWKLCKLSAQSFRKLTAAHQQQHIYPVLERFARFSSPVTWWAEAFASNLTRDTSWLSHWLFSSIYLYVELVQRPSPNFGYWPEDG